jgi:hypothetical protein
MQTFAKECTLYSKLVDVILRTTIIKICGIGSSQFFGMSHSLFFSVVDTGYFSMFLIYTLLAII